MKNPQTTFVPTFLTHIIARIDDGVLKPCMLFTVFVKFLYRLVLISEILVSEIHVMQGVDVLKNKWEVAERLFRTSRATVV